jgi:hypothetical protein
MESDRGLKLSSGSMIAKRSMNFLRDAYQLASQHASSPSNNYGPPGSTSQGLSPHFSQPSQNLRPYAPSHSNSWPGQVQQSFTHLTPNLVSSPQPFQPAGSYTHFPPPPPLPSQSPSPSLMSPISPVPSNPVHGPPPSYHSIPVQSGPAKPGSPGNVQIPPQQRPQIFSPDDFNEIKQSEMASMRPALPPRPSPSPQPQAASYQVSQPSMQQYQATLPHQPVYHQPQHANTYPPPQQISYQQQHYPQQSPPTTYQQQNFVPSHAANVLPPPQAQIWPQSHAASILPPATQQQSSFEPPPNVYEVPAVSVSPPIAELSTPSPVQAQFPMPNIMGVQSYPQQNQPSQYTAYQAYSRPVGDVKPPLQSHAPLPAGVAELPG